MYLKSNLKEECSGCTACMNICPKNAIEMIEDNEGFKYPKIDNDKCIKCGACYKICPNIRKDEINTIQKAYGVKHKDEKERVTSRSGGVFIALSDYILKLGGVVYGAELDEDFNLKHNRAVNKEQRNKFKGSKYIQSNMNDTIKLVQNDLKSGRKVLFSGTACQVSGVKACVQKEYQDNLYTCDIICHGVPSGKIFRDFLMYVEKMCKKKIKEFNFRDKSLGWNTHFETATFEDGTKLTTSYFRQLFYGHNILRPSCYKCNYANIHRPADITIADFWGVDEIAPKFMDQKGVSLTIINNEKGKKWFEEAKKDLQTIDCSLENCLKYTYTLNQPTPISENRDEFWNDYANNDFEYIINKYTEKSVKTIDK